MTATATSLRALALEITENSALKGIAIAVPSERQLSVLIDGAPRPTQVEISEAAWAEMEAWISAGDAGLPARPAPLSAALTAAVVSGAGSSFVANRFASMPLTLPPHVPLSAWIEQALPALLTWRRAE